MNRVWLLPRTNAVIATMHRKESAIRPSLRDLDLQWCELPSGFDSDRFGTFTRDIPRAGDQREAARIKARAALEAVPEARIAIASEGAFGPHPAIPFVAGGHELVLLIDRDGELELFGSDVTTETNYGQSVAGNWNEVEAFARRIAFPSHGIVLMNSSGETVLSKEIGDWNALRSKVLHHLATEHRIWLEADMRAHRNPTRMQSIGRAAVRLAEACRSLCPGCGRPGWIARASAGRPCRWCGAATNDLWLQRRTCASCGHEAIRIIEPDRSAEPGLCPNCNP